MDSPHVVILPFPTQGHNKPMLMLAELLSQADFTISFIITDHCHLRLHDLIPDEVDFRRRCPGIEFICIPDGLPADHPRTGEAFVDMFRSITTTGGSVLRDAIAGMSHAPSCIVIDGLMSFANDVAAELGIPAISFRTDSAVATWSYFFFEEMFKQGDIPAVEDMDKFISCIPGFENIVRRRDLPTICQLDPQCDLMQIFNAQTSENRKASALILNTFEELESPIISHLHSIFPAVYPVGPLHTLLNSTTPSSAVPTPSSNSSQLDQSCLEWLDSQKPKSVLYVSFGTRAIISRAELMELWYGLVNSEKPFLWAINPELIDDGSSGIPEEVKLGSVERGKIVSWAPQEAVLAHGAVGGFLSHCGWNSTLESICAGQPMICRPMVVEQPINSRYVSEVWKMGLELKDNYDRTTVEKIVRELMDGRREEIAKSAAEFARLAENSVREGGSSRASLDKLVQDIRLLHLNKIGAKVDN